MHTSHMRPAGLVYAYRACMQDQILLTARKLGTTFLRSDQHDLCHHHILFQELRSRLRNEHSWKCQPGKILAPL